jgi:hypothetical protein
VTDQGGARDRGGRGALTLVTLGDRSPTGVLTASAWDALRAAEQVVLAYGLDPSWQDALDLADVALTAPAPGGVDVVVLLERAAEGRRLALLGPLPAASGEAVTRDLLRRSTNGSRAPQVEVVLGSWDPAGAALLELVEVMDRLRSPGGCPWDAEQTHESLLPYALEEAYELVEAVELGDRAHLVEELGDLLLQVVFHARVAQEHPEEPFDVDDVAAGIVAKLRRRHPHVFADAEAPTAAHVEASWDRIKAEEKGRASVLDGVPVAMPALARAHKVLGRVERAGLDVALPTGDEPGDRILREVAATRAAGLEAEREARAALRRYEDRARAAERGAPEPPARLRSIDPGMDPAVVAAVDERLAGVVAEHGVAVPLAVESGSRAWGFPSPDSDYDCRFLYVRPAADYLSPWPHRDVVETPLDAVLDVGGWDLRKALQLLVKGNATVLEWLRSPIAYDVDREFRDTLLALADEVVDRDALRRHHLHVGLGQRETLGDGRDVPLKRVFYALRPAVTLRWLREHPDRAVPPMDLPTLLAEVDVAPDARAAVEQAVALKAVTRELGTGRVPPVLLALLDAELVPDEVAPAPEEAADATRRATEQAAEVFRTAVARWGPGSPV